VAFVCAAYQDYEVQDLLQSEAFMDKPQIVKKGKQIFIHSSWWLPGASMKASRTSVTGVMVYIF
jgi:hypothetical protein